MAKVRVRNTSNTNLGFSFSFLSKGQQCIINEGQITDADRRLMHAKGIEVSKIEEINPAPVASMVKPAVFEKKEKPVPEKEESVPNVPSHDTMVTPADVKAPDPAKPIKLDEPKPVPVSVPAPAPAPEPVSAAPVPEVKTIYTREQLEAMNKAQLKGLVKGMQVDKRNRNEMVNKILESQTLKG